MREYTLYQHKNKINNKSYIGITKQKPENRWGKNGRNYKNKCPYFWNAIQKYGWDNFEHIILEKNLSKKQACKREKEMIKELNTQNKQFGYNILEGGDCPTITPEVRKKMSEAMKGNKNGLGHPCSEEKKKKISQAQKGKKLSESHKKNISEAKKGKSTGPCSEEKRLNIIKNKKDKKPVICLDTGEVYESIQFCARQLNLQATLIVRCCKGTLKTTGGLHF